MLLFLMESNISHIFFFSFFKTLSSLSFISLVIFTSLSSNSLILSSVWSALFSNLSYAFLTSVIKFFSSRISFWFCFRVLISLVKCPFCAMSLLLSALNCLSEFFCILLNFFRITLLNFLSFRSQSLHDFEFCFSRTAFFSL